MSLTTISPLLALSFFAIFSILALDSDLKVEHDSGVYIALGKSLVTGQGYSSTYLAGHPPHTRYPPVFPSFLAPLIGLIGFHVLAMKLLMVALAMLTLYLVYIFLTDLAEEPMAFLVVTFTATSHGILSYSQSIMAEIPYLCLSLLALL
jgi:4-amino-4-deoxy-L-arabinose transferase-like glycosyltransferase